MSRYYIFPPEEDMYTADLIDLSTLAEGTYCYYSKATTWYANTYTKNLHNWGVIPDSSVPAKYRTLLLLLI